MAIYVRVPDLAYYEVTDPTEEAAIEARKKPGAAPPGSEKDKLEAYKLEYEKCAQRYDDVYKAAWTNFSYMAIVAGAILTFGGDRFLPELSAFLACLPLLFWWLASFEPLNKYGDQVIDRLSRIELILTEMYALDTLTPEETASLAGHKGLRHFRSFKSREKESVAIPPSKKFRCTLAIIIFAGLLRLGLKISGIMQFNVLIDSTLVTLVLISIVGWPFVESNHFERPLRDTLRQFLRVRFVVRCFAALLLTTAICLGLRVYHLHTKENKPLLTRKDSEVKVIAVDFNDNLGVKLDGITAKQAQELLQKAEQQKAASQAGK